MSVSQCGYYNLARAREQQRLAQEQAAKAAAQAVEPIGGSTPIGKGKKDTITRPSQPNTTK